MKDSHLPHPDEHDRHPGRPLPVLFGVLQAGRLSGARTFQRGTLEANPGQGATALPPPGLQLSSIHAEDESAKEQEPSPPPANEGVPRAKPLPATAGADPVEAVLRRSMVEETLLSERLRNAIEAVLRHFRSHSYRWNELLAEAEDVRNEVAVRALDRLGDFDPARAKPLPWLMGIATNVLRERARWTARASGRAVCESSCTPEQWNQILAQLRVEPRVLDEPSPVREAVERLGPEQQRLLRLRYAEDRPHAAIASALGISEEATRTRIGRVLQALRRELASEPTL